ncbi:MAG: coiled-coil protein [Candidatus Syntropharchaeia archaeon]
MIEELEERKKELVKKAAKFEAERNKKNMEASKWASMRDELNKRTKEFLEKAQEYKELREKYNANVLENKAKRDELNEEADRIYAKIEKLRKKVNIDNMQSFIELGKEIDRLEFKQQVEVLTVEGERQLVAKIAALQREYDRKKKEIEKNKELKNLLAEVQILREKASEYHKNVIKYAKLAQECHENMIASYKNADRVKARADEAHRNFVRAQEAADEAHRNFVKHQREIRNFEKIIEGLKKKIREDRAFRERIETRKRAKEIYAQFKQGMKLTTDDLLLLQRSKML